MKKTSFIIAAMLCCCLNVFSQATSLTIDCQTPGWLSSMINYGDQQTLENIKVTGYINGTDLSFLGSLNTNQLLHGVINLEEVHIVAANNSENNKLTKGYFGGHIQHLILPKSLVSAKECLTGATLDTLTLGGESLPSINSHMFYKTIYQNDGIRFNESVKCLILREGVTTIERCAFYNGDRYEANEADCVFESITFPSSLTTIEELAFEGCKILKNAELTDNIEEIGDYAFANTRLFSDNDTIRLPRNLKKFHLSSFAIGQKSYYTTGGVSDIECYGNQHIYIPKSVETIDGSHVRIFGSYEKCYLHIDNENPPSLTNMYSGMYSTFIVYVPKSSIDTYKRDHIWQNTTILAEPNPAKSIDIDVSSIEIKKGNTIQLNAVVLPDDADDKRYVWSSSNPNIVSVSQNGIVTAISSGEAKVFATLDTDNTIIDSCFIKVYQPVIAITLNTTAKAVKVGDTFNLEAIINPIDADNKNVIWSSEDNELAIVVDGKVTALKPGIVRIYAKSEYDSQISASCEVTITQPTTGIELSHSSYTLISIGDYLQLEATVIPEDASNKIVNWKSSNESVCVVSNGKVVAVGFGTAVIIAITEDGGSMATCTITVEDASGIDPINYHETSEYKVYTLDGKPSTLRTKGIKLIKFPEGNTLKVIVK